MPSAIAPTSAGPRVKPKSRNRLVVALAMPVKCGGTVFTADAVIEQTANANPMPTSPNGTINAVSVPSAMGRVAASSSPAPMIANPPPSSQRGLTRCSSHEVSGISSKAGPCNNRNATDVRSGACSWIGPSRIEVAYAVPRNENMPTTATIDAIAKRRLRNSSRRSNGDRVRRSTAMNNASPRTAMTKASTTVSEPQPSVGPSITPTSSAKRPMARVI